MRLRAGALFGFEFLDIAGDRVTYLETGAMDAGSVLGPTTVDTFGPNRVPTDVDSDSGAHPFSVLFGQLDISVNTAIQSDIGRAVTTTNTYLVNQTYEIDGAASSSTPEPASLIFVTVRMRGQSGELVADFPSGLRVPD